MKFLLDELIDDSESEDGLLASSLEGDAVEGSPLSSPHEDYTYINESEEDEAIPHLRLPKQVNKEQVGQAAEGREELQLKPELLAMVDKLDFNVIPLHSEQFGALVQMKEQKSPASNCASSEIEAAQTDLVNDNSFECVLQSMQTSFAAKLKFLASESKKQVEETMERKHLEHEEKMRRLAEEEQKRKQLELQKLKEEQKRKELEEAERLRKEKELKETEQREAQKKAEEEQKRKEKATLESSRAKEVTNFENVEKVYTTYKHKINEIKQTIVDPVKSGDKSLKSIISKQKRRINPKFGQLTNSMSQLQSVYNEVAKLVDEAKGNNLAYMWLLNFIAKATVSQSETEVRVKPESAVPLAKLTLLLMLRYEELVELMLARFIKKCPYVIGYCCKIDTEEGRKRMGWKRSEADKWEADTVYDERMSGMMTLFSVITRLPVPPEFTGKPHPLPIKYSWRILARIFNSNTQLITNTHFIVLASWWDACAREFLAKYGRQAQKVLKLVPHLVNAVTDAKFIAAARLSILYEDYLNNSVTGFADMVT